MSELEQVVRRYFERCSDADSSGIAACLDPDAIHYFPRSMASEPLRGADNIANRIASLAAAKLATWRIDDLVTDDARGLIVVEWSNFRAADQAVVRGDEWILVDPVSHLIREIRPYYAAGPDPDQRYHELGGYPYLHTA